jgi:hypothetical protein
VEIDIRKILIGGIGLLLAFDLLSNTDLIAPAPRKHATSGYQAGQDVDVSITLVTTDSKQLACASPDAVAGHHCEFESRTQKWSKPQESDHPSPRDILAPYKTTDDVLYLVGGLFSDPALQKRLSIDPPTMGEHARFVANCKLHLDGKMEKFDVRWSTPGQPGVRVVPADDGEREKWQRAWQPQSDTWVGTVSGCTLSEG